MARWLLLSQYGRIKGICGMKAGHPSWQYCHTSAHTSSCFCAVRMFCRCFSVTGSIVTVYVCVAFYLFNKHDVCFFFFVCCFPGMYATSRLYHLVSFETIGCKVASWLVLLFSEVGREACDQFQG